jgi:hypothetical protein
MKGKHSPRSVEAIHLGFASDCNMSGYKFCIPLSGKCIVSNQARFDEESFADRNQDMISGKLEEITISKFRPMNSSRQGGLISLQQVHVGNGEHYILRSKSEQDVYMKVSREAFFQ